MQPQVTWTDDVGHHDANRVLLPDTVPLSSLYNTRILKRKSCIRMRFKWQIAELTGLF